MASKFRFENITTITLAKIAVIMLLIGFVLSYVRDHFTQVISDDGVINAEIITIANSIPGYIDIQPTIRPGVTIEKGGVMYEINSRNGHPDSLSQYHNLKSKLNGLVAERAVLAIELAQQKRNNHRILTLVKTNLIPAERLEQSLSEIERVKSLLAIKKAHEHETHQNLVEVYSQIKRFEHEIGRSPVDGVVWAIIAKSGEYKENGSSLFEVINRDNIWVDGYFSEKYAEYVQPNVLVKIEVIATGKQFDGEIKFIRGGIGRIAYNSPIELPPQEFKERKIAARIVINSSNYLSSDEFYGVGMSVRVSIKK